MLLPILVVALARELVPSSLTTRAAVEVNRDCLVVIMTQMPVTVLMLKMLDLDAVEDVSCVFIRLTK